MHQAQNRAWTSESQWARTYKSMSRDVRDVDYCATGMRSLVYEHRIPMTTGLGRLSSVKLLIGESS